MWCDQLQSVMNSKDNIINSYEMQNFVITLPIQDLLVNSS